MTTSAQVLVVGAGPTGLVLALSLTRAGTAVRIVDRRTGISRESRALDVQARTLELYRALGLADRLIERGTRITRLAVRQGGRAVSTTDVSDFGRGLSPYPFLLCCPQDDHEALLTDELADAGVQVEWQTELVRLHDEGDEVSVRLRSPAGDEDGTFAYVGGCDGASSTVRQQLEVAFAGRTSSQRYFVADVNATLPEPVPSPPEPVPSPPEPVPSPPEPVPSPPEPVEGPSTSSASEVEGGLFSFCLSEDDFMLVVPARSTGTHRVIGLLPDDLSGADTDFADLQPVIERTTDVRIDELGWFSSYRVSHRVADHFRVGRAFLLGDAAHVHSPLGGQGMNTGIADAVNLAWKLAAVLQQRADAALLDTYEAERIGFARSLVATTDRLFGQVAGAGLRQRTARYLLFRTLLPRLLRIPASRRSLVGRVSQVDVSYRDSALSSGAAGQVRGGDRLPWVGLAAGDDNFSPLASLDWQLHVYGTVGSGLRDAAARLGLAVHRFPWDPSARHAGLRRDAAYLVRPDGYVALADPDQSPDHLCRALDRFTLAPRGPVVDRPTAP